MTAQDIRKEQEQVLAHAAERPSELFGLLDYIYEHTNEDSGEVEAKILNEIKRWLRDMGKTIAGKKVQLKKLKEQLLSVPTLTPVEAYYAMNSGGSGEGERVQSSHISDPTAKAAIGALDYIIRTWRDDYKKLLKKYELWQVIYIFWKWQPIMRTESRGRLFGRLMWVEFSGKIQWG